MVSERADKNWRSIIAAMRCLTGRRGHPRARLFAHGVPAQAQTFRGAIRGIVSDTTGAVLPGVSITVKNSQTGLERTFVTDEDGVYIAPELPIGDYSVTASLTGFKSQTVEHVTVEVAIAQQIDLQLAVGNLVGHRHRHRQPAAGAADRRYARRHDHGRRHRGDAGQRPRLHQAARPGAGRDRRPERRGRLPGIVRPVQRERQPRPIEQLPARRHRHERRLSQPAGDQRGRRVRHPGHGPAGRRARRSRGSSPASKPSTAATPARSSTS